MKEERDWASGFLPGSRGLLHSTGNLQEKRILRMAGERHDTEEFGRKEAKGPSYREVGVKGGCGSGAVLGRTLKTDSLNT